MIGIYKITSPTGRVYIGQSVNIKTRWKTYKRGEARNQIKLLRSFNKYGVNNHIFNIIECCSESDLNERERYWQEYYDCVEKGLNCKYTGYNDKSGSYSDELKEVLSKGKLGKLNPNYGKKLPKEWREKISKSTKGTRLGKENPMFGNRGKDHPMYGYKMSKENKLKVSLRFKGITLTEEHKKKVSQSLKGRFFSEDHRKKISQSLRGKTTPKDVRKKISESVKSNPSSYREVINTKTLEVYKTIKSCYKISGYSYDHFRDMLLNKNPNKTDFILLKYYKKRNGEQLKLF